MSNLLVVEVSLYGLCNQLYLLASAVSQAARLNFDVGTTGFNANLNTKDFRPLSAILNVEETNRRIAAEFGTKTMLVAQICKPPTQ